MSTPLRQAHLGLSQPAQPSERAPRFADQWAVLLTTHKRDGTPIGTPVNIVIEGDHAFIRTYDRAWKVKRMQHDPRVQIAPSTWRGRPTGPALRARAQPLSGSESEHAGRLIDRKHPVFQRLLVRFGHRVQHYQTVHFELRPEVDVRSRASAG